MKKNFHYIGEKNKTSYNKIADCRNSTTTQLFLGTRFHPGKHLTSYSYNDFSFIVTPVPTSSQPPVIEHILTNK